MNKDKNPINVVTIGGGKGQAMVLTGLKKYNYRIELSAIVSMVDNGGSTGRLREELNIPSFGGDFRDVLTSLSLNQTMVDLWQHRYEHGSDIKGHSVGNLILLGLAEQCDWSIPEAIKIAREILDVKASIYPSTLDQVDLVAEYDDGEVIVGQDEIDNNMRKKYKTITNIYTKPQAQAFEKAVRAIKEADAIILSPGDLYGSLLCNIIVPGISQALAQSQADIFYITNLMTKVNQTHGWPASRFIREVQRYIPRPIDYAIVNSGDLGDDVSGKSQYSEENWQMVENDIEGDTLKAEVGSASSLKEHQPTFTKQGPIDTVQASDQDSPASEQNSPTSGQDLSTPGKDSPPPSKNLHPSGNDSTTSEQMTASKQTSHSSDKDSPASTQTSPPTFGSETEIKVIKDKIWYEGKEFKRVSSDVIPRSFIRHDPQIITEIIMGLLT